MKFCLARVYFKEISSVSEREKNTIVPKSVNYHFTRVCNYSCGFCFHTAKTSFMLSLVDAKRGFEMLKKAGKY